MKMRCLPILLLLPLTALPAQSAKPKLAVLPMAISEKIDADLLFNVPEAISEELLKSRQYVILDRTSVGDTLKELEHQLSSGLVNEADVKKAGELLSSQLGAELIVSIKVSYSPADRTYILSAKIVKIQGSEILAQESDKQTGAPSVLLDAAHRVGQKLVASLTEAVGPTQKTAAAGGAGNATGTPAAGSMEGKKTPLPAAASGLKARVTASYVIPFFAGGLQDAMDTVFAYYGDTTSGLGFAIHYFQPLFFGIYVSGILDYASLGAETTSTSYNAYSVLDFQVGAGWSYAPTNWLQCYLGLMAGGGLLTLGDYWVASGASDSGFCLSFEIGADAILADHWTIALRISVTSADFYSSGAIYNEFTATDLMITGLHVGVGYAF